MVTQVFKKHCGLKNTGFTCLLLSLLVMSLSGCVSKGTHEALIQERDQIIAIRDQVIDQRDQLLNENARLSAKVKLTEEEKMQVAKEAAAAKAEIDEQRRVYENLEATFAKERQANKVKIEMIQSGVKVNLANDILFPSGSAELNEMGIEVLTRAAAELMHSPYQTTVAGFTDDIPISEGLKSRYPTNWELAGARAASVVRLLEKEGVPPERLLAISFGQNSPVDTNVTPEGRSKNRRIEIVLRPVPISMN
jgi:chemotaxis protein MotB